MQASKPTPHLIVTVHGIRTFGKWQERLEQLVRNEAPAEDTEFCHFKLGYFSLLAFLIPPLRWLVVRRFRNELRDLISRTKRSRVDLVGHSFGTHVIGWALWGLRPNEEISIHTVILSGSVLRSGFNWARLIGSRVGRVVNDCGALDKVLLLSQIGVLFTGMAGRTGFSGMTSRNFRNRFSMFGHSGYFEDGNRRPDDRYMRDNWVELLVRETPIRHFNDLPEGGALSGLVYWLSNNAEPVKLMIYLAPAVAGILWVWGQRQEAVHEGEVAQISERAAKESELKATSSEKAAKESEGRAIANERRAVENERLAKQNLFAMQRNQSRFITSAAREMLPTEPARALGLVLQVVPLAVRRPDRPIVPEALSMVYNAAKRDRLRAVLDDHFDRVNTAEFSRDGSRIVTSSKDNTARIWDAKTGAEVVTLRGHTDNVHTANFSPDGKYVVTASWDKTARIWEVATGLEIKMLAGHTSYVNMAAFDAEGAKIVTASDDRTARVWDAKTGALISTLRGFQDKIDVVTFSPNGKLVLGSAAFSLDPKDKTARIWDAQTGETKAILRGHTDGLNCVAFSSNGLLAVTGSTDNTARVWDLSTGKQAAVLKGHTDAVVAAHFSHDGTRVVTASEDKTARIWDVKKGSEILSFHGHTAPLDDAKFSPDETNLVTSSQDNTVRIWDATTGAEITVLRGHTEEVSNATYSPDGTRLVSASMDSTARIWDATTKTAVSKLSGVGAEIKSLTFSRDGARLIATSTGRVPVIWDTKSGRQILALTGHTDSVYAAAFNADGNKIVTASADNTARIWDSRTGSLRCEARGHESIVWDTSFSWDDTKFVTASSDNTAKLWDATNCKFIESLDHDDDVYRATFNRDATRVLTVTSKKVARLWSVESGKVVALWDDRSDAVNSAKFSDDGTLVVIASEKGSIRICDATTGNAIRAVGDLSDWVHEATFSPDGKFIVTAQGDHTARVIDVSTGEVVVILKGHESSLRSGRFTSDGARIVTGTGGDVRVWDVTTGAEIDQIYQPGAEVKTVAISLDGKKVAIGLDDQTVQLKYIPTASSESWLPAARARTFSALADDDKLQFGLDTFERKPPTTDKVKLCEYLAGSAFDPARGSDDVVKAIDPDAAIKACEAAQDTNAIESRVLYSLGRALEANKQYEAAERAYTVAANAKYGMAFYGLASLYDRKRRGIVQDSKKAADFYNRALEAGVVLAGAPLGRMFWDGNGVERDPVKARSIWERAAAAGDPFSHQELGWLVEYSRDGKTQDLESALYHYLIAARLLDAKGVDSNRAHLRGASIAHDLPIETVARIWQFAQEWKPSMAVDTLH